MKSHFQLMLLAVVFTGAANAIAGNTNVCQLISQDGLNSCKHTAAGDYWKGCRWGGSWTETRFASYAKRKRGKQCSIGESAVGLWVSPSSPVGH
jgi:hypothetical protein